MEFGSPSYMRKVIKSKLTNYIRANNREKVDRLLSNSANLELLRNERYFNPFVVAIKENKLQMFDIMLQHGLEFDRIELIRDRSKSSLRKRHGKRKLDKLDSSSSDEKGSDLTVDNTEVKPMKNGFYSNTLVEAIKRVNLEAVERLLRLNVNVNSTNYRQIPLQIAYNVYAAKRDKYFAEGRLDEDFSHYEVIYNILIIRDHLKRLIDY